MFCPRQWGLIHLSQEWEDNRLTVEGQLLHENVDNPFYRQKNGDIITLRSVHIASHELGLYGIADAIELLPAESPDKRLIFNIENQLVEINSSHPSWVRGLKLPSELNGTALVLSHPSWMRGLKHDPRDCPILQCASKQADG
jgi:hypothetical protein